MADTTKTMLGNYELNKVLGDGAEGRVYQAVCSVKSVPGVKLGELVAIKRLFKRPGQDKEPQQFRRQIDILSRLNHPNIVRYKDSFVWRETELEEDLHCLVMELLDGEPLKALLEKNPRGVSWETTRHFLAQVLDALEYANEQGVIHRDLKPSNIHITSAGVPKLVDFGIARQDDGEADATSSTAGAKGTFDYMAPDFAKDGKFRGDEQSDIFSFGVILHYTLTGGLPFPALGEDANRGYFIRWLGQTLPPPDFRHPIFRVLNQASACIGKCLQPDRLVRFKTFREVRASFAAINYRKLKHGVETYEFEAWLGKGGFGEVFRARRLRDHRAVAVKRLFGADQSARFVREAKILREASHPNLTEYVDFVEAKVRDDEREYYLILEFLEGMPGAGLRERIKSSASGLEPVETLQVFARYLDCLDHLHRNGIIHRDLKPGNLYAPAGQSERAKIFDLGIAHDDEGTRTRGQVPGTLDYMPPEFAAQNSGRGSPQSDLYSLGVTLFQALTRKLPFPRLPKTEAEAWVEFFRRSEKPLEGNFEHPVFQTRPELIQLIRRCLARNPAERFKSALVMRDEINALLIRWELQAAGRHPDQATEVTLFVKSTAAPPVEAMPESEQEFAPAAAAIPVALPAPETPIPVVSAPDPVELENQRLAAEEAARKNLEAEELHARLLAQQAEQQAAEVAARRKLMEAKWQEDEEKRKTEELAAQELQRAAETEEVEKKRRAREQRHQHLTEIKTQIKQQVSGWGRAVTQLVQKVKARGQMIFARVTQAWQARGGFRGLAATARRLVGKALDGVRRAVNFIFIKLQVWRSSDQANRLAGKFHQTKRKTLAGWLAARGAAKIFTSQLIQKWRSFPPKKRRVIIASVATLTVLACVVTFSQTRSHLRASAYDQAVARANAAFSRADFATATSEAEKALAIRGDDSALQKLARDSQQQYQLRASLEDALKQGQAALANQDYTNALLWADAALAKSAQDVTAASLRTNAQQRLDKFAAAATAARLAFANADFARAETSAAQALDLSAKDAALLQLKADAHARLLALAAYRVAMTQAQTAFDASDFTNAVAQADEAARKIPGDTEAVRLRARAQRNLDDYHQAVADANAAFASANFPAAQESADMALTFYSGDPAMQKLKADAGQRFSNQKAYVDALKNSQTAFDLRDYSNAALFATAALNNAPGDRTATRLRTGAQTFLDEYHAAATAAAAAFKNGDYVATETNAERALVIYANDVGMLRLKSAALEQLGNQKAFQVEMADARAALARNDFAAALTTVTSALKKNPTDPVASKLKNDAEQSLKSLSSTIAQAQTAYVLENYDSALALADKAIAMQNQNTAMLQLRAKILRRLDGELAGLLASFGLVTPPELKYAEIKLPAKLGPIGDAGRPYYLAQVERLEKIFRAGNWLTADNRQTVIQNLTKTINDWE